MKRGEIWTQSGGSGYAGKPRPVLIVQSDLLADADSVITCLFTSQVRGEIPFRVPFKPSAENGLSEPSALMTEKLTAVPRRQLGRRIGALGAGDMVKVESALLLVLGFAS